jgi:hypothetical protein
VESSLPLGLRISRMLWRGLLVIAVPLIWV